MSRVFHSWYDRYVPDQRSLAGPSPLLLTIKFQEAYHDQKYADILLADDESQLHALPFVRLLENRIVYPRRAAVYGEPILGGLEVAIRNWQASKTGQKTASIDVFTDEQSVLALAKHTDPQSPVIPAFAAHGRLFTDIDRYTVAANLLGTGRSLDLDPKSGYGLSFLRRIRPVDGDWSRDPENAAIALWFGYYHERDSSDAVESAFAVHVPASNLEEFVERASREISASGKIVITTTGEDGAQQLRSLGFTVDEMRRPALRHTLEDEWIAVRDGRAKIWQAAHASQPVTVTDRPLRICFMIRTTSITPGKWGDITQVERTASALRGRGHHVDVVPALAPPSLEYDIMHLTRLTGEIETMEQAKAVRNFEGPVVLMPIFNDHAAETMWGMQAAVRALWDADDDELLANNLQMIKERRWSFMDDYGRIVVPPPARTEFVPGAVDVERFILENVDYLIGNAYGEIHAIYRHVDCRVPFAVVPTSTDANLYHPAARDAFVQRHGLENFVLFTGRLEARKNQILLMLALANRADRPIVLIGGSVVDDYPDLLRALWRDNVTILANMPEEELAGAYAAARVVAMPSWDEVVSLSSVNAAAATASLVFTRNGFEHEYFRDDAEYCDPADMQSIAAAIDRAWESHDQRRDRREALRERVGREYTWDRTAELTEAAYYRVRAHNPRGIARRSAVKV
jgi:glycosyltransferase involved in cell wall biosynthesis